MTTSSFNPFQVLDMFHTLSKCCEGFPTDDSSKKTGFNDLIVSMSHTMPKMTTRSNDVVVVEKKSLIPMS